LSRANAGALVRAWHIAAAAVACGLLAGACDTDLTFGIENAPCDDNRKCLDGYECNAANICVQNLTASHGADSGDTHSDGGSGGDSGTTSDNGGSASTPQGGAGGAGYAGTSAGYIPFDAGVSDGGDACVPLPLYVDTDRDGYGVTVTSPPIGCPQEGWSPLSGDCRDDIFEVNPGQITFFGGGYPDPDKPDDISFDYDCANGEQAAPDNLHGGRASPVCQGLGALCTQASGYIATTRSGVGLNALCGSTSVIQCAVNGLGCGAVTYPNQQPFRCR
jgi:hypothetical protein